MSRAQNPTVIDDSLVVNQRLYAKEKLIVDLEAKFKQDIKVLGNARINGDVRIDGELRVDGITKLYGAVKMNNLPLTTINDSAMKILVIAPNGAIQKVALHGIGTIPDNLPIYCPPGDVSNPWWSSGLNKLYVACPQVNVGVSTSSPIFKVHVEGISYSQKLLAGNTSGSTGALINGISKNNSDRLLHLGVKIGASPEVIKVSVSNDGALFLQNTGNGPAMTIQNGLGHALIVYSNAGTKILQLEDNGTLRSRQIIVDEDVWPDFVFSSNYKLPDLTTVAGYIDEYHHLPGIPSASEIENNGLNVGEMQKIQMQKIEELTLYLIQMNEKINLLEKETELLKNENSELKNSIRELEND
ncbi:MAG: hypothetical protein IPM77_06510 [Crocinitomicaceae bacterium]|nr:hypothetical protein [Crocinitomicaceae bacterium]